MNLKSKKIMDLLYFIKKNIVYYKYINLNNLNEDNAIKYLRELPIIKKEIIRNDYQSFLNQKFIDENLESIFDISDKDFDRDYIYKFKNGEVIAEYTSGTTGSPFVSLKTPLERFFLGKSLWKMRSKAGNSNPEKMFQFIHTFDGRSQFPFNYTDLNDRIQKEMEYLAESTYEWWHIYPGMLADYANYVKNTNIEFKSLKGIECNGAFISLKEIKEYEAIFKCKITNNYGTREIWNIAYQTECSGMEINPEVFIELIDDNGNVIEEPNVVGRIVVTSLKLHTIPFVRYYIGDLAYYTYIKDSNNKDMISIVLLPGRHMISGTTVYGNQFFRDVVIDLMQVYNMKCMKSVYVKEIDFGKFIVNVVGNQENRKELEKRFIDCVRFYDTVDSKDWCFQFKYDDTKSEKSIFTSILKE